MIIRVDVNMFRNEFERYNRDNFSYKGYEVLFDFLEECHGDDFKLDVIAICCDFSEMTIDELKIDYSNYYNDDMTDDEFIEELREMTTVLYVDDDRYIIQSF